METFLIIVAVGALCIGSFIVGAKVGQRVVRGETVELPNINPLEAYRKHEERKKADAELDNYETLMRNIERYDGTSRGQEEVK